MRRTLALMIAALGLWAAPAQADDPALELRWHLDVARDTDGGFKSWDSSGRERHPLVGSRVTTGAFGTAGRGTGAPFDGNGGALPAIAEPTLMAWVRGTGASVSGAQGWIAAKGTNAGAPTCDPQIAYGLRVQAGGRVSFQVRQGASAHAFSAPVAAADVWDGDWHAVAGTLQGGQLRIYLDGVAVGAPQPANAIADGGGGFFTGSLSGCLSPANEYTGDYDEIRLYKRALSAAEIGWLHGSPLGQQPRVLPVPPAPSNVSARYPLDDLSAADISGHGLNGSSVAATLIAGRYGNAFSFPNFGNGFLVADSPYLKPQAFTVSTWVKYTRGVNDHSRTIVGKGAGAPPINCSSHSWALRNAAGDGTPNNPTTGLQFYVSLFKFDGGQEFVSPPILPYTDVYDGTWHAVAATYGNGAASLYLDGQLRSVATATTNSGVPLSPEEIDYGWRYPVTALGVGRYPDPNCALEGFRFPGAVDDLRLYDRVLTGAEIAAIHTSATPANDPPAPTPTPSPTASPSPSPSPEPTATGTPQPTPTPEAEPGLAVKWHLDGREVVENTPFFDKVFDASGNGRHGTVASGGFSPGGRFGNSLVLAPTGDTTAGVASLGTTPVEPNQLTVLSWVRASTASNGQVVLAYGSPTTCTGSSGSGLGSYGLLVQGIGPTNLTNGLTFYVDLQGRQVPLTAGEVEFADGQWHAVAGTYDGAQARLYVDGVLKESVAGTGAVAYAGADRALRAGGPPRPGCGAQPFRGSVDEPRVYSRALTGEEIAYLHAGYHRRPPRLPISAGPKNVTRPALSGTPKIGSELTCVPGTWTGATSFQYLWERAPRSTVVDGDAAWVAIDGAAGPRYTPVAADESSRVRCREIAFDSATSEEAVSPSLRVDVDIPTNSVAPSVVSEDASQPPRSGFRQVCEAGTWTGGPAAADFSYRWLRDNVAIAGATQRTYVPATSRDASGLFVDRGDGNHDLSCEVVARNDVGPSAPVVSARRFVIDDRPAVRTSQSFPRVTLGPADDGSQNPLRRTATCDKGTWVDAYADHPDTAPAGFDYVYQWFRRNDGEGEAQGVPIAGATGPQLKITADQIGRYVFCKVTARNPLGERTVTSPITTFIPLPVPTKTATFETVFRDNRNDPVNMTAVDVGYRQAVSDYAKGLFAQELDNLASSCQQGQQRIQAEIAALPSLRQEQSGTPAQERRRQLQRLLIPERAPAPTELQITLDDRDRCWLILRDRASLAATDKGVLWVKRSRNYPAEVAGCSPLAGAGGKLCTDIGVRIQPVSGSTALALSDPALQQRLDSSTPERILYDIDGDGGTDISCPGSSPVLRAQLVEGRYPVNVVIVERGSATTGLFSGVNRAADPVFFPNRDTGRNPGFLRATLPKWCRTSMVPPPDPKVAPCTSSATIGSVQLQGNMCPINVRAIPDAQTKGLPQSIRDVISRAAAVINAQEFNRDKLLPGFSPGTRAASLTGPVFRADTASRAIFAAATNTAATVGNLDLAREYARTGGSPVDKALTAGFAEGRQLLTEKASFALDQIYAVNAVNANVTNGIGDIAGALKVNGVTVNPSAKDLFTIIAPSDAAQGIKSFAAQQMEIFSPEARAALGQLPLTTDPKEFKAKIEEKLTAKRDEYLQQGINYTTDRFKALLDKLNFPFKLTGSDVKVKLNDNGTATLEATAAIPGLTSAYPDPRTGANGGKAGGPITTSIKLTGDLNGRIQLQDVSLRVAKAYLIGVQLEKLSIAYNRDAGLNVGGLITFPLSGGEGIGLENFRLGPDGEFLGTEVFYAAGVGKGLQVAPGVFLTEIGGGFSTKPYEIKGRAAVSAGLPSSGSGCPSVGIKGGVTFHWSPTPLFMQVKGDVVLVCIPFANFDFYADSTGWVKASAAWFFKVPDIANLNASIAGELKTADVRLDANGQVVEGRRLPWQIKASGSATFPYLPIPDVGLNGVISSLGVAACGSVRIKPPLLPSFRLAAGGAVRFPNGIPPITYVELLANFRAFTGCDLSAYLPLGSTRVSRQLGAPQVFTLAKGPQVLSFEGAGAAPRVKLTGPDGKVYDFADADPSKQVEDAYGAVIAREDRTVVILPYAKAGSWRVETAAGAPPVARIQRARILDEPSVEAKVTGKGSQRTLAYDVERVPGQRVTFVETATSGHMVIGAVEGGGKGKLRYTLGETGSPKRTITALVSQDGFPRTQFAVARYVAANPTLARPRVRLRRKGTSAVVSFRRDALAARYDVVATFTDGRRLLFEPAGRKPSVTVPGVGARGGLRVQVTPYSLAGRAGRPGTARLKAPTRAKPKGKPRPGKRKPVKGKGGSGKK